MFATVDESVRQQRLLVCQSCESFSNRLNSCRECGCYMPAKASFAQTECPQGKWLQAEAGNSLINKLEESILNLWNN